jgi:hypothetical protein
MRKNAIFGGPRFEREVITLLLLPLGCDVSVSILLE